MLLIALASSFLICACRENQLATKRIQTTLDRRSPSAGQKVNSLAEVLLQISPDMSLQHLAHHRRYFPGRRVAPVTSDMESMESMESAYDFESEVRQPSEKQLQYAEALAEQLGRKLPDSAKLDTIECSEFVDQCRAKIPPSEKQAAFAQRIASEAGIDLPESALSSVQKCSEYIDANMHLLPTQDREPTERQVAFARRISEATGIELPPTVTSSALACSDYIDANIQLFNEKSNQMIGNDKLPTQRQLAFAQKISREGGIPLPPSATSSATACSEFIDGNIHLLSGGSQMRGSEEGSSQPSQRQLLYAVSLARQRNLGLSAEVLKDRNACSQFIESCLGGNAGLPQANEVNLRSNDSPPDAADSDAIINRSPPRPSSVDYVDAALLDPLADKLVNSAPRTD